MNPFSSGGTTGPAPDDAQWAGDCTAAGITTPTMDVFKVGPSDLSMRVPFEAGSPTDTDVAWSTVPASVGAALIPPGAARRRA